MNDEKHKNYPSTITLNNFSSTAKLAKNEVAVNVAGSNGSIKEQDKYGFVPRELEHPNSSVGSLIHLLKSSLGTGILAMPNAVKNGGLVFGFFATVFIGLVCTYCVHMLVSVSQEICKQIREPFLGFSETSEAAFKYGPQKVRKFSTAARWTVDIALVVTYFMSTGVYVVFITDSFQELIVHWLDGDTSSFNRNQLVFIIMAGLLITCQVRELKHLVPYSFLANVFMVAAFIITLYYMFTDIPNPGDRNLVFQDITNLPVFFSTVIFAMEGVGVVMPVENSMKKPQQFLGCPGVLNLAMGIVVLLYSTIGFFGYLKFGEETSASISADLPIEEIPAQLVKLFIGLSVFFTYNLQMFVAIDILWRKFIASHATTAIKRNVFQVILRCTYVVGTIGVAIGVPDLENIIGLVGSVCFSTLGLLIPSIIETVWRWENLGRFNYVLIRNILIGAFALFALVSGSARSIKVLING